MNILVISSYYPMPDRASGELRFYQLLKILSSRYEITFCPIAENTQRIRIGEKETENYKKLADKLGLKIIKGIAKAIKYKKYNAVIFEFWNAAEPHIDQVRKLQPQARIIIDSVDVGYNRLKSKSKLTGLKDDYINTEKQKRKELSVYKRADIIITVTDEDAQILHQDAPELQTITIPNIHIIHKPFEVSEEQRKSLLFIGNFKHEPNIDAVYFLCNDIFPLIKEKVPDVKLSIVGNSPPESVVSLTDDNIQVLGYVPDTSPYLNSCGISVAPLRYGGGMKGKVGEAMSHGLPVVTTTIGAEGIGLTSGKNVLIADTAEEFSESVIDLIKRRTLYENIRLTGHQLITERYSEPSIRKLVYEVFSNLEDFPVNIHYINSERLRKSIKNFCRRVLRIT